MLQQITFRRPSKIASPALPSASRLPLIIGVTLGLWLTIYLYANTLNLPFYEDDFGHIRWLSGFTSPLEPFITAVGVPAYRPLGEMFLKIWYILLGRHDATWLRFLNISMHSLNVALVAAIAFRLDRSVRRYWTAGLSAVLFAALPYTYQAVPWINVFFYPVNNLLQLFMLLTYWEGRKRGKVGLIILALFFCFLSPFEIEYGLVNGGLLFAIEAAFWLQKRQKTIWMGGPLLGLGLNLIFLAIWLVVPKSAYEFGPPTLERLYQISYYLLQGLTYPAAPLSLPLMNLTGISDLAAVALVSIPVLIIAVIILARRRQWALLVASLLIFLCLQLPGWLTLTFNYYVNGPRLFYPSGPAMVWLWAGVFVGLAGMIGRYRWLRTAVVVLIVLVVLGQNIHFVQVLLDHYQIVGDTVPQLGEIAREIPVDRPLLVVNMPSWVTPPQRFYALGNNGVQYIPFFISIDDTIYAENDSDHPVSAVQFHNVRTQQPYFYGMLGPTLEWEGLYEAATTADTIYLAQYTPEAVTLQLAGRTNSVTISPDAFHFQDDIALELAQYALQGDTLNLDLNWQVNEAANDNLTVFVHLYGPDGSLITQADGYPLLGMLPFWLWEPGRTMQDHRTLTIPPDAPPGTYRVGVGIYDQASAVRQPVADKDGNTLPDDVAILLTFEWPDG
ncbi:MAG: hypothetical protein WAM60_17420 [Candidatus Promineifilaceae bacterium]